MAHPYFDLPMPIVIGHKGSAGDSPENTLLSFERALAQGAHILESDVHVTRDGVPVLIHDETVDRIGGRPGRVAELRLEELREVDAGHYFSFDGGASFPYRGADLRIPTVEEAFDRFPEARFNLELKENLPGLAERVIELVQSRGRADHTLLTAGDDSLMARVRDELKRCDVAAALGASVADVLDFVRTAGTGETPASDSMALQIPADFGGRPLVTRELLDHAHVHGVQVHVWTINEEPEMQALLDLGVDGLVTDFPGRLARLLETRRGRGRETG